MNFERAASFLKVFWNSDSIQIAIQDELLQSEYQDTALAKA